MEKEEQEQEQKEDWSYFGEAGWDERTVGALYDDWSWSDNWENFDNNWDWYSNQDFGWNAWPAEPQQQQQPSSILLVQNPAPQQEQSSSLPKAAVSAVTFQSRQGQKQKALLVLVLC